jgi:hypothetical protein
VETKRRKNKIPTLGVTHGNITEKLGDLSDILAQEIVEYLHVRLLVAEHHVVRQVLNDLSDEQERSPDLARVGRYVQVDTLWSDDSGTEESQEDERADGRVAGIWESVFDDFPNMVA